MLKLFFPTFLISLKASAQCETLIIGCTNTEKLSNCNGTKKEKKTFPPDSANHFILCFFFIEKKENCQKPFDTMCPVGLLAPAHAAAKIVPGNRKTTLIAETTVATMSRHALDENFEASVGAGEVERAPHFM